MSAAESLDVEEFNLLEIIDPCDLLLLPPAAESHPWESAVEKMPAIDLAVGRESLAAVHQLAIAVEPEMEEAIELPPVKVAPHVEPDAPIDYQAMSSQQLRAICTQHGIKSRSVKADKHLSKPEMIAPIS